uniref:Uncharacterized protein n=1 Tax=Anguilla anguilla TaxID=7936 RepID=A0A0E9VUV5_ANGAN
MSIRLSHKILFIFLVLPGELLFAVVQFV